VRFILTGSARHQVVPELADYLTGRVRVFTLWPFAVVELRPGAVSVIDRMFDGSLLGSRLASTQTRAELVDTVMRGGYPLAVGLSPRARAQWFGSLADLLSPVDPAAATRFGALLETFVVVEIRSRSAGRPGMSTRITSVRTLALR
jgi:hypothetical protein